MAVTEKNWLDGQYWKLADWALALYKTRFDIFVTCEYSV